MQSLNERKAAALRSYASHLSGCDRMAVMAIVTRLEHKVTSA